VLSIATSCDHSSTPSYENHAKDSLTADQVVWLGGGAHYRCSPIASWGSSLSPVDLSSRSSYGRWEPTAIVTKLRMGQEVTLMLEEEETKAMKEGTFCYD
jgi:hypothetical protein